MNKNNNVTTEFSWEEFESNVAVKTIPSAKTKVLCKASYAQDLYNKMMQNLQTFNYPKVGDTWGGVIVSIERDKLYVNIGNKDNAVINMSKTEAETYTVGETVEFIITNVNEDTYQISGSISEYEKIALTEKLIGLYESKTPLKAKVLSISPNGGYIMGVDLGTGDYSVQTFMHAINAGVNRLMDQESIINTEMDVLIDNIDYNNSSRFTVSRKRFLELGIKAEMEKIKYNHIYNGTVTGTTEFGIFVEFNGCLTGMIHKANVHPDYVDMIMDIQPGTPIEFFVKEIIGNKLILTQIHRETLWDTIQKGQVIEGKVSAVKAYGILVSLDDDTKGLIPSDLIEKEYQKTENIKVRVISVNKESRKIILKPIA